MTGDALLALCEDAVAAAKRKGAASAECFALSEAGGSVEMEKGHLSSAEWEETSGFGLRVIKDQRVGFAYASSQDRVPEAVEGALKAAGLGRRLPKFAFPAMHKAPRVSGLYDEKVEGMESGDLIDVAKRLLSAVVGVRKDLLVVGGGVHAGWSRVALANSEGLSRKDQGTSIGGSVYVVQRRDGVSTGFQSQSSNRDDCDWERVGAEAGRLCVDSAKPTPLKKGGVYECVLRPEPASDLLGTLTVESLLGKPARRGETYYSGKKGKQVMNRKISLIDDPTQARGLGSAPFDDEGTAAHPKKPIVNGVLKNYLFDNYDGAEWGEKTTGNALRSHPFDGRSYKSPPSAAGFQMRVEAPKKTTQQLVGSVDDGFLVYDLMGVHTANQASGDFSVTSSVLFRIRKGAVEGAVAPLSLAGNLHNTMRKEVTIGNDVKSMGGDPSWTLPSILFQGFTATP